MTKLILTIELDYPEELMHGNDPDAQKWFFEDILGKDRLILHSNELGDEVGDVRILGSGLTKEEIDYIFLLTAMDAGRIHQLKEDDWQDYNWRVRHQLREKLLKLEENINES